MKTKLTILVMAVMAVFLASNASVGDATAPKAEKGVIVGEVIDIASYAMKGAWGKDHVEGLKYRCELGFPMGILEEETGEVFIAVYKSPVPAAGLQTANAIVEPHVGTKVVVQGLLYRAPGINVIRIAVISEY